MMQGPKSFHRRQRLAPDLISRNTLYQCTQRDQHIFLAIGWELAKVTQQLCLVLRRLRPWRLSLGHRDEIIFRNAETKRQSSELYQGDSGDSFVLDPVYVRLTDLTARSGAYLS